MKTTLAALLGPITAIFILSTAPAKALDIYTVTEAEIQQKLDEKLPISGPTKLKGTATLLSGAHIDFKANGTIEIEGAFEVHFETTSAFLRGRFAAVTNLTYKQGAIHLDRTALTDFEGSLIANHTGNTWKDGFNNLTQKGIEKLFNNSNTTRDILALLLFKKLEEKPIYVLDGSKSWHALARNILTEDSLRVSEDHLTISVP